MIKGNALELNKSTVPKPYETPYGEENSMSVPCRDPPKEVLCGCEGVITAQY